MFLPHYWSSGELLGMPNRMGVDRCELPAEYHNLISEPESVRKCYCVAVEGFDSHPEVASPTVLLPARAGYKRSVTVPRIVHGAQYSSHITRPNVFRTEYDPLVAWIRTDKALISRFVVLFWILRHWIVRSLTLMMHVMVFTRSPPRTIYLTRLVQSSMPKVFRSVHSQCVVWNGSLVGVCCQYPSSHVRYDVRI